MVVTQESSDRNSLQIVCSSEHVPGLLGAHDQNLRLLEEALAVHVLPREDCLEITGDPPAVAQARAVLAEMLAALRRGQAPGPDEVRLLLRQARDQALPAEEADTTSPPLIVTHRGRQVRPKTRGQRAYVHAARTHDLLFCTGPAGTGKTYLAMAMAAAALSSGETSRIVLTRPLVEAGEELGFLPGDMLDKVNPYLRPLHDALHDVMGADQFQRHLARGTIEVVPLAYMRGRTLNDSYIVLDEAQNTTPGQMKMALTRLGFGSRMIITGDITQVDLPSTAKSGMVHALQVLRGLPGLAVVELTAADIVRHDLVQRIVLAYAAAEAAARERPPGPEE